jgi:hypothetical protein
MVQLRWHFRRPGPREHRHQLPLRRVTFSERSLPDTGFPLLRVHRRETAEIEVEIHQGWRGLVLLCGVVAPNGGGVFTLLRPIPAPTWCRIHNRQMVVLDRSDWLAWLDLTRPEQEVLRPLPAGSLAVEQVR